MKQKTLRSQNGAEILEKDFYRCQKESGKDMIKHTDYSILRNYISFSEIFCQVEYHVQTWKHTKTYKFYCLSHAFEFANLQILFDLQKIEQDQDQIYKYELLSPIIYT